MPEERRAPATPRSSAIRAVRGGTPSAQLRRMRTRAWLSLMCLGLVGSAGCGGGAADGGGSISNASPHPTPAPATADPGAAQRAIAEANIIELTADDMLYAMSKTGTLSAVDVWAPGRLMLRAQM